MWGWSRLRALPRLGHRVVCVDTDGQKIAALNAGETIIHEAFLPELLQRHRGRSLQFSTSLADSVRRTSAVFIAVGTPPTANGALDLSQVEAVAVQLAPVLTSGFRIVVCKSTVPVKTTEWISRVLLLNGAGRRHFDVACNPEFLREGTAVLDFLYPDRIVAGARSEQAFELLRQIYAPLASGEYYRSAQIPVGPAEAGPARLIETSLRSAEMIKNASNAFLAMKISFVNAVATLCESSGADVTEVSLGVGSDTRIGNRFLKPGIGYGGSCFPKDLASLRSVANEHGYDFRLLEEVASINSLQRQNFVRKVRHALWTLNGKQLGVLGLSYKGGTDDIRESPAIATIKLLLGEGCSIVAYDPAASERAKAVFAGGNVRLAKDAYEAAEASHALLILTDWEEFAELDLSRVRQLLKYPILIDGRNLFPVEQVIEAGLCYFSVGRSDAIPLEQRITPSQTQPAAEVAEQPQSVWESFLTEMDAVASTTH